MPTLAATLIETMAYDTPLIAATAEGSDWYLLLLIFPFWSCIVSMIGVWSMFEVKR